MEQIDSTTPAAEKKPEEEKKQQPAVNKPFSLDATGITFEPIKRLDNLDKELKPNKILNINIGVLGHIDSGKTSLCKALSTIASTAGFDKNP